MGLADDIINGNYTAIRKKKKNEESLADKIINGTYKAKLSTNEEEEDKKLQSNMITKSKDEEQKNTIWEEVGNFVDGAGKVVENLWQGTKNGIRSLQQTVSRAANNTQAEHVDLINEMNKKMLDGRLKNNPEEVKQINTTINNPFISGDEIREESTAYYNKIQQKKDENILRIQENAESINNPIGKYIASEIAPRHRSNVTRYDWWTSRDNLLYWFCNRKLL